MPAASTHAVSLAIWGSNGPTVVQIEEPSPPGAHRHARRLGDGAAGDRDGPRLRRLHAAKIVSAALDGGLDRYGVGYNPKRAPKSPKTAEMLTEVRKHGLARALGDPLPGVNAFAAPVFDYAGHVALVITAMGPEASFDAGWDSALANELRECASGISKRLGYGTVRAAE